MEPKISLIKYWKELPTRDDALAIVYDFLGELSRRSPETANNILFVKDIKKFRKQLHLALMNYLSHILEDDEWSKYENLDLAIEINHPRDLDEDLSRPEFSGSSFNLHVGEEISVQIGMKGEIIPVRVFFTLVEEDNLYYLRYHKICLDER